MVTSEIISRILGLEKRVGRLETNENRPNYGTWANRPSSPFSGQGYFATDRGLEYYYDGTRWLTTEVFSLTPGWRLNVPITSGATNVADIAVQKTTQYNGAWLDSIEVDVFQTNAITVSNYVNWNIGYVVTGGAVPSINLLTSGNNNQGQTNLVWYSPALGVFGISTQVLGSNVKMIEFQITANGTTGNVYHTCAINLRGIG